jgi:uncharacterized tellurite resistance protein B-like protein
MHEQDLAIVKALVPLAWADGEFADREKEMIDAILDAYSASDADKKTVHEYAATKRTLDDVNVQDLSADDRRVLMQHAILLSFADGTQSSDEVTFIQALAKKLRIPDDETKLLMTSGAERAKKHLKLL